MVLKILDNSLLHINSYLWNIHTLEGAIVRRIILRWFKSTCYIISHLAQSHWVFQPSEVLTALLCIHAKRSVNCSCMNTPYQHIGRLSISCILSKYIIVDKRLKILNSELPLNLFYRKLLSKYQFFG